MNARSYLYQFHVSATSRTRFGIDRSLFQTSGRIVFANFNAARKLAEKLQAENLEVFASDLNAFGLLDEIFHLIIEQYQQKHVPDLFQSLQSHLEDVAGKDVLDSVLKDFTQAFPPDEVFAGEQSGEDFLNVHENRQHTLQELLLLWLENRNPAYNQIRVLVDENELQNPKQYRYLLGLIESYFDKQPAFGDSGLKLIDFLSIPARRFPDSIMAQFRFIVKNWQIYLGHILERLLISLDFMREEHMARFDPAVFGPGPVEVAEFGDTAEEPEQFSEDLDWMPRVVLMAKSTYVWLDQLSKQYQRDISRLDQIPDEELDRLARYGFSGLWLIGLWERSHASKKIKQINGNSDAVASAYSLTDYQIANDLGGEEAYQNLRRRCAERGIRLASDMVPNHMAIDSRWVVEHPDWFLQSPQPPFPSYTFNGPDLSSDPRVGIFLEDGYWNRTDAAVVFKRVDKQTGSETYIYHGNDGTSMPWNDTAQLNYLLPYVREGVIQTILHVARKFPIIRFDAAMTLAKKHFQRLWFPEPGHGGDIPSRAEHAMSRSDFNKAFPTEFWREVVDRVQLEVPDTLLLAEAFWMMEGYFVRTLGMHRVYNSAFMNMLKNEDNKAYRQSIKNVLEFNSQILKRYVNFMNNPDEETAVMQFGKDDKYFGVCVLMSTMPGLPMFGHGQIEGFAEKYGMEYRRSYWNEPVNEDLVRRHEREIFPLLKKRYLFSDVENFYLFDVYDADGVVNENVYAYSNRFNEERALVVYNNKFEFASGWINLSAAFLKDDTLQQQFLMDALGLESGEDLYLIFHDHISNLEFIRPTTDLRANGLYVELGAFKYMVFGSFRLVKVAPDEPYDQLSKNLNGKGVASIDRALLKYRYREVLEPLAQAVNRGSIEWLLQNHEDTLKQKAADILSGAHKLSSSFPASDAGLMSRLLRTYRNLMKLLQVKSVPFKKTFLPWNETVLQFLFVQLIYRAAKLSESTKLDTFFQTKIFTSAFDSDTPAAIGLEPGAVGSLFILSCALERNNASVSEDPELFVEELFGLKEATVFLLINSFEGTTYFNRERFERLISWLLIKQTLLTTKKVFGIKKLLAEYKKWILLAEKSAYRPKELLALVTAQAGVNTDK